MSYYISPRFLNKLAVHITKNFLELPGVRVPLILGVHGRKGEGKSFQCELVFEKMGIEVVHISGGELESPDAGDPARLLRLRYREAAELIRVRGCMVAIMINDLDAGAGRFDQGTQYTVNTQLVNATLMNIADNPTNVQLPGSYDSTPLHRVPMIVTGNDFSTLYAPLIRDGRMEKFYWEPDRADKLGIVGGVFSEDGLSPSEIEQLVDTFIDQPIDFFGALRSRLYDEQVLQLIQQVGFDRISARVVNSNDQPPEFHKPDFRLERLLELGRVIRGESDRIQSLQLVREYNQVLKAGQSQVVTSTPEHQSPIAAQHPPENGNGSQHGAVLSAEIKDQLQQLLSSGYKVGLEYADVRRFKTGSWQSAAIESQQEPTAIAQIELILAQHPSDYVRLIGIDPKAKRRVAETLIQRPS